jgi:hypothetical protein
MSRINTKYLLPIKWRDRMQDTYLQKNVISDKSIDQLTTLYSVHSLHTYEFTYMYIIYFHWYVFVAANYMF